MSGTTTNNSEILTSVETEDFDPVREIRRLRQDLAHRLALLHAAENTAAKAEPMNDELPEVEDPLPEVVENIEEEREPDADRIVEPRHSETVERFVDRFHKTEHLLSRLRHPLFEKEEIFLDRAKRRITSEAAPVQADSDLGNDPPEIEHASAKPVTNQEVMASPVSSVWISTLKKMNSALVLLGFFGAVLGVLYYSRGEVRDIRIGLPLAVAGLSLIVIGVAGRWIQEHLNRRDRQRGKLTTVA